MNKIIGGNPNINKIGNTVNLLPLHRSSLKQNTINFKISNGQIQPDSHNAGNVMEINL